MIPHNERCRSLKHTVLHHDNELEVMLRCEATEGHPGRNHRNRVRSWKDGEEDGWLEQGCVCPDEGECLDSCHPCSRLPSSELCFADREPVPS